MGISEQEKWYIMERRGMIVLEFVAHIRQSDLEKQLLSEHLKNVQQIAERIGKKIGIPHITGLAGMFHDMGKYSDEFLEYLEEAVNNPENPPKRGSIDHSTAGGKYLMENFHTKYNFLIECVANAIFSHHGQLKDMVNADGESPFLKRKNKEDLGYEKVKQRFFQEMYSEDYIKQYVNEAAKEISIIADKILKKTGNNQMLFKKIIRKYITYLTLFTFSALLDADRTDSRQFDENTVEEPFESEKIFNRFAEKLEEHLKTLEKKSIQNEITLLRQQMSNMCYEKSKLPTGIYTLSIPTGGGKTLASLRFALNHALKHSKERIIYVVPFTTIIEQNAEEVRNILDAKDYLLEHHSNVIENEIDDEHLNFENYQNYKKIKLAKDNWDAPIIFTTMVQFLNTFYSRKSRNIRRLHNLTNSIIIFDEVQSVPVNCVTLFNEALNFLKDIGNSTVLLCTATQPALQYVEKNITVDGELIDDLPRIVKAFKRTNLINMIKDGGWTTEELAQFVNEQLNECNSVLVILNTKSVVKKLYDEFSNSEIKTVHLSTSMCPKHRKQKIYEMRKCLKNKEKIVCISTQLIEAGVDVSFECVIRSLAGLDSIAQAAGRCNRHGEVASRDVYIINHKEEVLNNLPTIKKGGYESKKILRDIEMDPTLFDGELLSENAMTLYFRNFYQEFKPYLDYPTPVGKNIYEMLLGNNSEFLDEFKEEQAIWMHASFETASKYFEVIDSKTHSVLVPYDKGKALISELYSAGGIENVTTFLKEVQQYIVNVFDHDLNRLIKNGVVEKIEFKNYSLFVAKESAYDDQYGLSVEGEAGLSLLEY